MRGVVQVKVQMAGGSSGWRLETREPRKVRAEQQCNVLGASREQQWARRASGGQCCGQGGGIGLTCVSTSSNSFASKALRAFRKTCTSASIDLPAQGQCPPTSSTACRTALTVGLRPRCCRLLVTASLEYSA